MSKPQRRYIGPEIYVEQQDGEGLLVSWRFGHRRAESIEEFFDLLDLAVKDTYHPHLPPRILGSRAMPHKDSD